jgi:hypothetical protein
MTDHEWCALDVGDRVCWALMFPRLLGTVLGVAPQSILIAWDGGEREVFKPQHRWMLERERSPGEFVL